MKICDINEKDIKYAKITYVDKFGDKYEIKAELKSVDTTKFVVLHKYRERNIPKIPQVSLVKIVTDEAMYLGKARINEILSDNENENEFELELNKPTVLERRQKRKHPRIDHTVGVVLSCRPYHATDEEMFLAKTVNISASGVKITGIKSLKTGKQVDKLNFKKYCDITLAIYLDPDAPISFEAIFVRHQEEDDDSISNAFAFCNPNSKKRNYIENFVKHFKENNNS